MPASPHPVMKLLEASLTQAPDNVSLPSINDAVLLSLAISAQRQADALESLFGPLAAIAEALERAHSKNAT